MKERKRKFMEMTLKFNEMMMKLMKARARARGRGRCVAYLFLQLNSKEFRANLLFAESDDVMLPSVGVCSSMKDSRPINIVPTDH